MHLLNVNTELCAQDGACIAECPARIIDFESAGGFPALVDGGETYCIHCGHCVAVCPHGAMAHADMTSEDCPPVREDWRLGPDPTEHFLRSRRSIRSYRNKPVSRDVIERLIRIARYAPSGHNLQPVCWMVVHDSDAVRQMVGMVVDWMRSLIAQDSPLAAAMHMDRVVAEWEAGEDRICRGAPHLIIVHAPKADRTAPPACTLALGYLELAAPSLDLGTCWAGYFTAAANMWPPLAAALSLPEGHVPFGALMVGFPRYTFHRLPLRNEPSVIWR